MDEWTTAETERIKKALDVLGKAAEFFEARADMAVGDGKMLLLSWANGMRDAARMIEGQERKTAPAAVRNRDIPKLTAVLYTMQDVQTTERRRMWMQDRLFSVTQRITGMPGGHGEPTGYEANFAAICEMEERYDAELTGYMEQLKEAERVLNGIENQKARTFVEMKYLMGFGRKAILNELNLKRWQYERMSEAVEQAGSMGDVVWEERYLVSEDGVDVTEWNDVGKGTEGNAEK